MFSQKKREHLVLRLEAVVGRQVGPPAGWVTRPLLLEVQAPPWRAPPRAVFHPCPVFPEPEPPPRRGTAGQEAGVCFGLVRAGTVARDLSSHL